jgi:hypothetical protein
VIDAETRGVEGQGTAPTREDDGFGLAVMGSGVEVGCALRGRRRVDFEAPAAHSERRPIAKDENIWTDRGAAIPIKIGGREFLGRVLRRGGLPLAEFDAEGRVGIGVGGVCGVISPENGKEYPIVLTALNGAPIGKSASRRAK